jgi:hypothetical protein
MACAALQCALQRPNRIVPPADKPSNCASRYKPDQYPHVDVQDFYRHVMNTARAIDSDKALAKLFVLPLELLSYGRYRFQTILVAAHQITDGLTIYRWNLHFLDLLNLDPAELEQQLTSLCSHSVASRLPPAQEDLYPPIRGNAARQRWFWAVSRILRHTRRPPPSSFPNPLRRTTALAQATSMPPTYSKVLSYSKIPPLNSCNQEASLSPMATNNLRVLCRNAGASIGSGCRTHQRGHYEIDIIISRCFIRVWWRIR